jgi:hypothetical protein
MAFQSSGPISKIVIKKVILVQVGHSKYLGNMV